MKAILLVTALFLSACTSTGTVTPQSVVDWLSTNCGVIVNAADVAALIDHARAEVMRRFGIELEREVELVGRWQG